MHVWACIAHRNNSSTLGLTLASLPAQCNTTQVKNNLLGPVLALFVDNGPHTANLVHSAIIELLDFIRVVRGWTQAVAW